MHIFVYCAVLHMFVVLQMSEFHAGILRECHVELQRSLEVDDHLLGQLYDNFIVSRQLRDRVRQELSREARVCPFQACLIHYNSYVTLT